ncbi:MAG: peroxiredoxin family protein [Planctomycetota bacterium]
MSSVRLLACLPLLIATITRAEAADLAPGAEAPDFTLEAVAGELSGEVTLSAVAAENPVVLVVLRGYPGYQCGLCSRQVAGYVAAAKQFAGKDARVLMVYPGPEAQLAARANEFLRGSQLPAPLTLLLDPDYTMVNAYGLRWDAPKETAYPSAFLIDADRKIQFVNISRSHGGRTTANAVLAKL